MNNFSKPSHYDVQYQEPGDIYRLQTRAPDLKAAVLFVAGTSITRKTKGVWKIVYAKTGKTIMTMQSNVGEK